MFNLERHREGYVPCRGPAVVHEGLPKQVWVACTHRPSLVYHLLLSWDGHRALDCQLRDLPSQVPGGLRRYSSHGKLDFKPHRGPVIPVSNPGDRDLVDIPNIWCNLGRGIDLCSDLCAGNKGAPDRGGGEDVGGQGIAVQVLEEEL